MMMMMMMMMMMIIIIIVIIGLICTLPIKWTSSLGRKPSMSVVLKTSNE